MNIDALLQNLQASFPLLVEYKYVLIFLAAGIEGFSTIMMAGFLLSVHSVTLVPTFIALTLGEIMNGFLWYSVGYWGGAKSIDWIARRSQKQQRIVARVRSYMEQYTARAILFAKMTFSITVATQILVGSVRYSIKRFAFYNIIGSIGWVVLVLSIGFFFGTSFTIVFGYIRSIGHILLFVVLALVIVLASRRISGKLFIRYLGVVERVQGLREKIKNGFSRFVSDQQSDYQKRDVDC